LTCLPASAMAEREVGPPRFLSSGSRAFYARVWAPAHGYRAGKADLSDIRQAEDPIPSGLGFRPFSALATGVNVRLNDPTGDGAAETQSETAAASNGPRVLAGWNDSKGFTTGTISSYAYSSDAGATWHDGGDLPLQGLGAGEQLYGDPGLCANKQ